ncbi:UNVERIFIED_ORG: hypothetical protein M2348_001073 [Sphingomonas sp. R1F5B]
MRNDLVALSRQGNQAFCEMFFMAQVLLLASLSGARTAVRGEIWECGEDEAVRLVEAGFATPVVETTEAQSIGETADAVPVDENADAFPVAETAVKRGAKAAADKPA